MKCSSRKQLIVVISITLCLMLHSALLGEPVNIEQARVAAKTFLVSRYPTSDPNMVRTLTTKGRSALEIQELLPLEVSGAVAGYIVNLEPSGFILFSADDQAPPIKIYSNNGSYDNLPQGLKTVLELELLEDRDVLSDKNNQHSLNIETFSDRWNSLTSDEKQDETGDSPPTGAPNESILTTTWNQNNPYNYYCPTATGGPGGRAYAGCTAAALSQVLRHHSSPGLVTSNHTYSDNVGFCTGTHSISDAGMGSYDWANMPSAISTSSPEVQQQAIGQLMYHCGVALESNYEADGTGANPTLIPSVLQGYFNYTSSNYQDKSSYTSSAWYNKISDDIDDDLPIFYAMWPASGWGHAVVCDGYRNGNEIHLDLGWSGAGTAWYNIDSVSYSGYTWTIHSAVFDITPQEGNAPPILYNAFVNPLYGNTSTNFEFLVDYYDVDGDVPDNDHRNVCISGIGNCPMTLKDGTASNGTYHYVTTLPVGSYSYQYVFINAYGGDSTSLQNGPYVQPDDGCGIEIDVEVSNGPATNNIEIEFEYGPDLFDMESQQWYAPELPQNLWIDSGQQLMFSISVESNNHTFTKWEFRDDEGDLVRETTSSNLGFILNSGNRHATAFLSYTPIDYTISGTVHRDDSSSVPGGVDLTLTSSQQTLNQHIDGTSFSFTGVDGGVPVSVTYEASDGGYAFSPPSLSWSNLKSDHTGENITGYSSDTSVPMTSFVMVPPAVSEDSSVSFSWIGEDDVSDPANLMYQYKLDGVDADWSIWTLGTSILYDLENGEYTFWVRAKDEAENINQAPTNYTFAVNAAPIVISAERINRSIWASQVTLEMPVGASNPTDSFVLLPEHSGMSDSELIPVTIHSANDPCACGANENIAGQMGLVTRITEVESGWLITLPESISSGQTAQYDIVWGKTTYFGWQELITLPNGFPNGGSAGHPYIDDNLRVWRSSVRVDNKGTGTSCDDDAWISMDMCDKNDIIIPETIMRFVPGECWGGVTGTSTDFYYCRIFPAGSNSCYLWGDYKYTYDGSTDLDEYRYGLQLFNNSGNTVNSTDGIYYDWTWHTLPAELVHNMIWIMAEEPGTTDSAWFLALDANGNEVIPKTVFDTISKNYSDIDIWSVQQIGPNVLFLWDRSWETDAGEARREIAYEVWNTSGSVVKDRTILSQTLLPDSVEEGDEYELEYALSDNDGKVWVSYSRGWAPSHPAEYFYSIIGIDGNVWKGPIQTSGERSFHFCDSDGYIWAKENGQFFVLNPDDTTAVSPRSSAWIPNQSVGSTGASVGSTGYRLYDRWSSQYIGIDVPSGIEPDTMRLYDLNLWDNDLHLANIELKKDSSTIWSQSGQFTGHADVDVSGTLDEGLNILTMTQEDFLGGQMLITFPYIIPKNLTITSSRGGSVVSPGQGQFPYPEGSIVDIEAAPEEDYQFFGWTGTAVDAGKVAYPKEYSTRVTVDADYDLQANFTIIGDFTGDSRVNLADYAILASYWLQIAPEDPWVDINDDDVVDVLDLATFSGQWLNIEYVKIHDFPLGIDPQWTMQGEWEFGQPAGAGGVSYGNPDPTNGYTGDNVYGVNLNGDYSTSVGGPYYLTAGPLDCTGYYNIILKFARWLNTEAPGYVASKIEASSNGIDWNVVWENTGSSITDDSWQLKEYNISSTADNQSTVYLRWSYEVEDSRANPYSGWNIDDIQLWGNDFRLPEFNLDVEPSGWTTEGQWSFGQPSGGGGAYGNPDPCSGYEGENVFGVNLSGDYSTTVGGPYCLTTGSIDCSGYHNISLQFARWLNTDAPGYVASRVEASNNGTDWNIIWQHTGSSDITDSDWQLVEYDMSSVANGQKTVYVRWCYEIIDSHAYPYSGWNIDEIRITGDR